MKTIIALHGNPGSPADWNILQAHLSSSQHKLIAADAFSESWKNEVRKGSHKKILIGHSWGAYRILKNLKELAGHVEKVILVAPYIKPERELSGLASALLRTPGIGNILIKSNHKKTKDIFFNELIYPSKISDCTYFKTLKEQLDDWKIWKRTVANKLAMQENPWAPADITDQIPITVLYGELDKITSANIQNIILTKYSQVQAKTIPSTGHGLLWSHPEKIGAELAAEVLL